ncbi:MULTISPECIES: hypothetical protein [Halorussus]|uniref:hypothetical protein n=1 Tax=Halorussus TaxID=1070314 RepID=UPI0020A0381A|nr:hypothetical protein [Halorussus vallis]USZ75240.1 hypothetical protein NGM07_17625 [Halorussus vallis]
MSRSSLIVSCPDCGNVYVAREHDGELILPTDSGVCECGSRDVKAVESTDVRSDDAPS